MDWKLLITTFSVILLAEMGDKTQLAVLTLSAESRRPLVVFLGGALAMTVVTGAGAMLGGAVIRFVPEEVVRKVAALLFVAIGVWTWFKG